MPGAYRKSRRWGDLPITAALPGRGATRRRQPRRQEEGWPGKDNRNVRRQDDPPMAAASTAGSPTEGGAGSTRTTVVRWKRPGTLLSGGTAGRVPAPTPAPRQSAPRQGGGASGTQGSDHQGKSTPAWVQRRGGGNDQRVHVECALLLREPQCLPASRPHTHAHLTAEN